jgi:hypothetical protein
VITKKLIIKTIWDESEVSSIDIEKQKLKNGERKAIN